MPTDALPLLPVPSLDEATDPNALLIARDRQSAVAHLDAQLGALLIVEVADSPLGTWMLPLSTTTMAAWMTNEDGERVTCDPEEALNLVVSVAMNDVNGHNERVELPDGRSIHVLTEDVATPELARTMVDLCHATVVGDLRNPLLCPPLELDERPGTVDGHPEGTALFWVALDRQRTALAGAMLERHAMQQTFQDPEAGSAPAGTARRRL